MMLAILRNAFELWNSLFQGQSLAVINSGPHNNSSLIFLLCFCFQGTGNDFPEEKIKILPAIVACACSKRPHHGKEESAL